MTVLTANRETPTKHGRWNVRPVAAGATIFLGALVALNAAGMLVRGATALNLRADGIARQRVTGGAADGEVRCEVEAGVYRFENSAAADAITAADVGNDCFIVDDSQVARTNGGNTRSVAGRVVDVEAAGVWVAVGIIRS